jgi:hypothetical protein
MTRLGLLVILVSACASDDAAAPAAPTNLAVTSLGAGAHLTWKDNSADETEFVIMRDSTEIARVPFNGVTFHDEPVTAGATYIYQVAATNDGGESMSNVATFVAP